MAKAAFHHFSSILGTHQERTSSINLHTIGHPSFDLSDLDAPFFEAKIWEAMKKLPAGKGPGPDGFTSEFLRVYLDIVNGDICEAFAKLYQMNGQGFHKLNEALLSLLPK